MDVRLKAGGRVRSAQCLYLGDRTWEEDLVGGNEITSGHVDF